jgi:hypothetical protein
MKITTAQDIISAAITEALQPFKSDLTAACRRDLELAAAAELVRPDKIKIQGDVLMGQAIAGDESAMKELEAAGGLDAWVASKCAIYPVKDGARHHHAIASAELFERASARLIPALEIAGAEVQTQFENVMVTLGEMPGGISQHGATLRNRAAAVTAAVKRAHNGEGLAWIFEQLGLTEFLNT